MRIYLFLKTLVDRYLYEGGHRRDARDVEGEGLFWDARLLAEQDNAYFPSLRRV